MPEPSVVVAVVVLVCGLPGAGKSSLLSRFVVASSEDADEDGAASVATSITIIEYDRVQQETLLLEQQSSSSSSETAAAAAATERLDAWRASRVVALERLRSALLQQQQQQQTHSHSWILLDDNFYLRSMRKQVYQTCQQALMYSNNNNNNINIHFGIAWLDTAVEDCVRRNQERSAAARMVPETVIRRMHQRFQVPSSQFHWERNVVRLNGSSADSAVQESVQQLRHFCNQLQLQQPEHESSSSSRVLPPVDPAVEQERLRSERLATQQSLRTQADQFWRRCVGIIAGKLDRSLAPAANRARQRCLQLSPSVVQETATTTTTTALERETAWLELFWKGDGDEWLTPEQKDVLRETVLQQEPAASVD